MTKLSSDSTALTMSLVLHAVILVVMALVKFTLLDDGREVAIESVFDEREQQEFTQELDINTEISENLSVVAGAAISTNNGGSSAPAVSQTKIETSESLKEPEIQVNVASVSLPGANQLGEDLGESEIKGETGAVVEGYGAAMSRLTQELIRLMRNDKVHVVWLFDESESMKDDQAEIRDQFSKVYEELQIAQETDEKLKAKKDADATLLTTILSYGAGIHTHTEKPTREIPVIQKAIDKIPIDETGEENLFQSIMAVCDKYGPLATRAQRKLAIVVLSDEGGDDGEAVEEAISRVKRYKAPVYLMGREAIFGYPYARMKWTDPKFGLDFWIDVRRGPETAFPEALQYDGLHRRWDSFSSGFGCYEQVRLARESGGIYFMLPGDEESLAGRAANLERKFEFLAMKEYQPLLLARREYEQERNKSAFRKEIWNVIATLNPYQDDKLNIREHWYAFEPENFKEEGLENAGRALRAFGILNEAVRRLEAIKDERAKEDSQRWRAAYDLAYAQCLSFRVRLFQFMLAVDSHLKNPPKPKDPKSNRWNVVRIQDMKEPDEEQIRRTKVDMAVLNEQLELAKKQFDFVQKTHPGTPWAQRAGWELRSGFGFEFRDIWRDPRYDEMRDQIKVPKL